MKPPSRSLLVFLLLASFAIEATFAQTLYYHLLNANELWWQVTLDRRDLWSYYAPIKTDTFLPGGTYKVLNDEGVEMFGPYAYPESQAGATIGLFAF